MFICISDIVIDLALCAVLSNDSFIHCWILATLNLWIELATRKLRIAESNVDDLFYKCQSNPSHLQCSKMCVK